MNTALYTLKDIAEMVMSAAEAHSSEEVFQRIAEASRDLVRARYAALGIPDGVGGLQFFKFDGIAPDRVAAIGDLPRGHGLLGLIMNERQIVRIEHIERHPSSVGFPAEHPQMDRLLGVPIVLGERLFGMLYLCDREDGQPFDERDQWLVETMAGYAALAIAGAVLRQQESRLTLLEERERISMELHDGIIQSLYAIGMQVELLRTADAFQPDDLKKVTVNLDTVIEDIRRYIQGLPYAASQRQTARACFEDLLSRLHVPPHTRVIIDAPDVPLPFPPSTYDAICQMANEAMSNAIRHAQAKTITLTVTHEATTYTMRVHDDGVGFDPLALAAHGGLGLRNLAQRAALYGGSVQVDSSAGAGTAVTITLPVRTP